MASHLHLKRPPLRVTLRPMSGQLERKPIHCEEKTVAVSRQTNATTPEPGREQDTCAVVQSVALMPLEHNMQ